jgi:hypothetical protein
MSKAKEVLEVFFEGKKRSKTESEVDRDSDVPSEAFARYKAAKESGADISSFTKYYEQLHKKLEEVEKGAKEAEDNYTGLVSKNSSVVAQAFSDPSVKDKFKDYNDAFKGLQEAVKLIGKAEMASTWFARAVQRAFNK